MTDESSKVIASLQQQLENSQTHARNHILRFKNEAATLRARISAAEAAVPGLIEAARFDLIRSVDLLRSCDAKNEEQITACLNVRLKAALLNTLNGTTPPPPSTSSSSATTAAATTTSSTTAFSGHSPAASNSPPLPAVEQNTKPPRRKFRPQIFADVDDVTIGAPAFDAGLRVEDRLLSVGGVTSIEDVKVLAKASAGKPLRVVLLRGSIDNPITVELTLTPGRNGLLGCILSLPLHLRPDYVNVERGDGGSSNFSLASTPASSSGPFTLAS